MASGSAAPSAPASGSVAPSGSASAGPSASGGGGTIDIAAAGTAFDQSSLSAPAGQAFQIVFQIIDASVQHDVQIIDGSGNSVFKGDLVTGVSSVTYNVPALPAGSYTFDCIVHPAMTGTLTVKSRPARSSRLTDASISATRSPPIRSNSKSIRPDPGCMLPPVTNAP